MKTRWTLLTASFVVGRGLTFWSTFDTSPALAGPELSVATVLPSLLPTLGEPSQYTYVGANKCKKCHLKEHKSWSSNKKSKALETLMPGQAAEAKQKHNLDPNKDYSTDAACLKCHTTGFGHPSGYAVPDAADEKAVKEAQNLAGVGCESCHGAGSGYMVLHEEIMKSKRTYKVDEMYAAGMTKIEAAACTNCHNDQSPTYDAANPFDFEKMKATGGHEHFELKQREK